MVDKRLYEEINRLVNEFIPLAEQVVKQNIRNKGISVSGDLEKSINSSIQQQGKRLHWAGILTFLHYGKVAESKRSYAHHANIEVLKEWILEKGLQHFQFVPGYSTDLPPLDDAARRIAYGIYLANEKGRSSFRKTYKGYLIYRPFFAVWAKYRNEIAARFANVAATEIFNEYISELKSNLKDGAIRFP
jgi:hypothetical protein